MTTKNTENKDHFATSNAGLLKCPLLFIKISNFKIQFPAKDPLYSIVDIETTGNGIVGNKITEISIFNFDGQQIVDEFTSLVNPECEIPYFITGLTGIDNQMVRDAPTINELAPTILSFTQGRIFVAHSVNFDYHVIKNELKILGKSFARKKLCTVRLSRRVFPGLRSYSLGKLCASLDIPLKDRHRARGDAHATVLLFSRIISAENSQALINSFLNARSQEATLPPSLPREIYDEIPAGTGIYFFKNGKGEIIYIGKAKNIKRRVLGHFYDKTTREVQLCRETATIEHELAGNELLALLMESAAIKQHFPKYNRAQKRNIPSYGIFSYADRKGILHLGYNRVKFLPEHYVAFYNTTDCRLYLEELCKLYHLCPKFCHLQENVDRCSHFRLGPCEGICRGEESVEAYNSKVEHAIAFMKSGKNSYFIKEKGRTRDEDAIILVRDGQYSGYGFLPKGIEIRSVEDILAYITLQKNSLETNRLVQSYTVKNPGNVIDLDALEVV